MFKGSTRKEFERFLITLDADITQAGEKYVALRQRLEKFFEWRDCENTEELTDIVFDRVTKKIAEGEQLKNAEAYCVSVAKFVLLENRREMFRTKELDESTHGIGSDQETSNQKEDDEVKKRKFKCLDKCLAELPVEKRNLIVSYFDTDEKTLISARKNLAKNSGVNLNTLRIRISRLKAKLITFAPLTSGFPATLSPGKWECSYIENGVTYRTIRFGVGPDSKIIPHPEQRSGNINLYHNAFLVEVEIPAEVTEMDARSVPMPEGGIFYGIPWTTPEGKAAAAKIPKRGKPYPVMPK